MTTPKCIGRRCARSRHISSQCDACIKACPMGALQVESGRLSLIEPACTACGACVSVCPMDALELDGVPERLNVMPDGSCQLRCSRAMSGDGQAIGCQHALSEEMLLDALAHGVKHITLVTAGCEGCPNQPSKIPTDALEQRFKAWQEILGKGVTIARRTEVPKDVDGGRRHLLGMVARKATAPKPLETVEDTAPMNPKAPFHLTKRRRQLITLLRGLLPQAPNQETATKDALSHVLVPRFDEESCTACGLCAAMCPNKALSAKTEGDVFTIAAIEACCTGCGLCADICTANAVTFDEPQGTEAFLMGRPIVKMTARNKRRRSAWDGITQKDFSQAFFNR